MSTGPLLWGEHQGIGCLRLEGELRHTLAEGLERIAERLRQAGAATQRLVIDLSDAVFMDSTVLGFLVTLAREQRRSGRPPPLLAGANADVLQMFDQLGLLPLFELAAKGSWSLRRSQLEAVSAGEAASDHLRQARLVLAAHQALVAADPRNAETFAGVIGLFEDEVRRLEGG